MGVQQRYFRAVLGVRRGGPDRSELTPSVLAAAAVEVLPVAAAGISLNQHALRVPLGWSSPYAAVAERQQVTLGDGPCVAAADERRSLVADAGTIAHRWPAYFAELERRTPFRSVAALPLRTSGQRVLGALELYAERPDLTAVLALDEAEAVAGSVADLLLGLLDELYDSDEPTLPAWIEERAAIDRVDVWTAVGMLVSATDLDQADALARLRGFAYSHDLTLDAAAARIVEGRVPLHVVAD